MFQDIFKKYNLPQSIKVLYRKNPEGIIFAKVPEYPGCMTLANNEPELYKNITDAILTYFDVPREEALKLKLLYIPSYLIKLIKKAKKNKSPLEISSKEEKSASFLLFRGVKHDYGKYSNIR